MSRPKKITTPRPAAKLGRHSNNPVTIAIDAFLLRWCKMAMKTRDRLLEIPKENRDNAVNGMISYWNNFASACEQMRYQNCRKIASRNVNRGKA